MTSEPLAGGSGSLPAANIDILEGAGEALLQTPAVLVGFANARFGYVVEKRGSRKKKGAVMERNTFDRILALLHEATLDDARWPAASALIDEACRARGNTLVFADGRSREDIRIFSAWFYHRGRRHRELDPSTRGFPHTADDAALASSHIPERRSGCSAPASPALNLASRLVSTAGTAPRCAAAARRAARGRGA